jgi:hypothetical protein
MYFISGSDAPRCPAGGVTARMKKRKLWLLLDFVLFVGWFLVSHTENVSTPKNQRRCLIVFWVVLLFNQFVCKVFAQGDTQKPLSGSDVGRSCSEI